MRISPHNSIKKSPERSNKTCLKTELNFMIYFACLPVTSK